MKLGEILDSIDAEQAVVPAIKRSIRKARHGFKSNSSNHVDRLTFLASCLHVGGDEGSAIALFEFIDQETETGLDGRRDLEGSLAVARLLLAHMYMKHGSVKFAQEMLARDGNDSSWNLEHFDESLYDNFLQDEVSHSLNQFNYLEGDDEYNSPKDMLRTSFVCYMKSVVLTERLPELEDRINSDDKKQLAASLQLYEQRFKHYLPLA